MELPKELLLNSIEPKKVYYFKSSKLNSAESHHFVCVKRTDNMVVLMTVCTSQLEKQQQFCEKRGISLSTLVYIKPDNLNLTKDTLVNCNQVFEFTEVEILAKLKSGEISKIWEITDNTYQQVLQGIHDSPQIEPAMKKHIPIPE